MSFSRTKIGKGKYNGERYVATPPMPVSAGPAIRPVSGANEYICLRYSSGSFTINKQIEDDLAAGKYLQVKQVGRKFFYQLRNGKWKLSARDYRPGGEADREAYAVVR